MKRGLVFGALLACASACGGASTTPHFQRPPLGGDARAPTPDDGFRAHPPVAPHASDFAPPPIVELKLSNGVRVLVVEKHDLPIVSVRVCSSHGARSAPPGVGALWSIGVFRGTKDLEAKQIYFMLAAHAIERRAHAGPEESHVELRFLSAETPRAIEILGGMLRDASFPEKDFEKGRKALIDRIGEDEQHREIELREAGLRQLYPEGHPYRAELPSPSLVAAVKRQDVVAYHAAAFSVERTTIVVAGDVTASELLPRLEKAFHWIPALAPEGVDKPPRPPTPVGPKVTYVDHPGDAQALVSAWWTGVSMSEPDFLSLELAVGLLGNRLADELRTETGITYGVGATLPGARLGPPPIVLQSAIDRGYVGGAVATILANVRRLSARTPGAAIIAKGRGRLLDALGDDFDTTGSIVDVVSALPLLSLPNDEYGTWAKRLAAIQPADVQGAAKRYLPLDALQLVVVGDESIVRPQVDAALEAAAKATDAPTDDDDSPAPKKDEPPPPKTDAPP